MKANQDELLQRAVRHQQAGRIDDARKLYEQALRRDPKNADALHLLGLAMIDGGQPDKGLQLLRRAVSYAPGAVALLNNLAVELCRLGRFAEALPVYDKILAREDGRADIRLNRALALRDLGRLDEALAGLDQVIAQHGGIPAALSARGSLKAVLGDAAAALADFDEALAIDEQDADCHGNRGNALMMLGRHDDAIAAFDRALAWRPDTPGFLHRRGLSLGALGRTGDALASYDAALNAGGGGPDLLLDCAMALTKLGRHAEAVAAFLATLEERPGEAEVLFRLGSGYLALGNHQAALDSFDAALAAKPGFAPALHDRGTALLQLGRYAEARAALAELLAIAPAFDYARGELAFAAAFCCDWTDYEATTQDIQYRIAAGERADMPFMCLAHAEAADIQRQCAALYVADKHPNSPQPGATHGRSTTKIHIAYLSGDFRTHPIAFLMAGVFEQHDRARFEVTAIAFQAPDDSAIGQRVHAAFERFIDVSAKSDEAVVALMRELGVDIAIDLMGHTLGNRPGIFARRAAPVQVNYLGYPGTIGASYLDAIIADSFVIPEGSERFFTETVIRLPHCFQANDAQRRVDAVPTRTAAGLPETGFVFCCFARPYKITPMMFGVAMRLLRAVPGSVLWLAIEPPEARANLQSAAAAQGVDPSRLIFAGHVPYAAHLARLSLADLVLDTYPFNGGTTVSDALWAGGKQGVPVVTRAGEAFASRMAGSLLRAVGLPELIATDFVDYERIALSLALDAKALAAVRRTLQTGVEQSPLFKTGAFCRDFEAALTQLHEARLQVARSSRLESP